jgi:hypothetical protein
MNEADKSKVVTLLPSQLKNDGNFVGNAYVDTVGHGHLRAEFHVGTVDAAIGSTAEGTAPLIEECDTTDGTYTDVTDANLADAIGATEDDKIFAIDVDLRKAHKRYMQVQVPHAGAGTTGCNLCIVGRLTLPEIFPTTAAGQGLEELIKA